MSDQSNPPQSVADRLLDYTITLEQYFDGRSDSMTDQELEIADKCVQAVSHIATLAENENWKALGQECDD